MPQENTQHFFSDARDTIIHGGTFTTVRGEMHQHIYLPSPKRYGLELLLVNITQGAFHNAADRGDPPQCYPHTRSAIRGEIMRWIREPDAQRELILWLYGPAGVGKTAIGQSIAEQCEEEGLLAASFFFSRMAGGPNDSSRFIATLAYQLSRSIPEIQELVLKAVEEDPTIFSRSLSAQMQVLVVMPLTSVRVSLQSQARAVIVDGIDECGPNGESQARLLKVLGAAAAKLRHIPIMFLVGSRPEFEIRLAFNQEPLSSLMRGLSLDNNYQSNADIRLYFNSKFREIRQNQLVLGTNLSSSWPTEFKIDELVKKSSGQFIFAATVMKFVNAPRRHPMDRLNIIFGLSDVGDETPFAALDTLYRFILSSVDNLPKVLQVLALLILGDEYNHRLTVDVVELLLGFEVRRVLVDMHALILVPNSNDTESTLHIHHASLYDFLLDRSRSRNYFIDAKKGHIFLIQRWLGVITNYPHRKLNTFGLNDCISSLVSHCNRSPDASTEIADHLAGFNFGAVLEKINDADDLYKTDWIMFLDCAQRQGGNRPDVFRRLQDEFYTFFFDQFGQYPPFLRQEIHFWPPHYQGG